MRRWFLGGAAVVLAGLVAIAATYETVPTHNTDLAHFDTILVLGSPADPDGKASVEQRERVMEGVREFQAGRAGHLIVTGGPAHNQWVEAEVMARVAIAAGVPAEDVEVEGKAENTIQNIWYSRQIMERRGWKSAEVVSSPSHLPRTGLILEHYGGRYGFGWRTHASRWPPEYGVDRVAVYYGYEAVGTTVLRWFGFPQTRFLPEKGK